MYLMFMIELVRSLHDGMSATVTVGGGKSEPFSVRNGMVCIKGAPSLLFCLSLVIDRWLSRCQAVGVEVQFRLGGRLVGERTRRPSFFVLSQSVCLQMMLPWCALVKMIWSWLSGYLMK